MRRLAAPIALALLLGSSAGCAADARSDARVASQGLSGADPAAAAGVGLSGGFDGARVERARALLRERGPIHGWSRGVVLRTALSGSSDHLRWTAAVLNGGGRLVTVESCRGESTKLAVLVASGDYVRFRTYFGCVDAPGGLSTRTVMQVVEKGAVS